MKGVYVLLFYLPRDMDLAVGALGDIHLRKGHYAYTGSAQNSIESRLRRHTKKKKKSHWHIDYLTTHAEDFSALVIHGPRERECELASRISQIGTEIDGFGCTDCRCNSHLFYLNSVEKKNDIVSIFDYAELMRFKSSHR